jgi:ATP-dependent DNA helicase DinG
VVCGVKFCPQCRSRMRKVQGGSALVCVKCYYKEPVDKADYSSLADYFPYKLMRPFQKEVLEKIEKARSTRFIIFEAPVGFGKSAIAASVCRYLGSAHILTSTKQLQDQYAHDFQFPMVKGKANFQCYVPTSSGAHLPCSKGRCRVDWKLKDCPHYLSFAEYDGHREKLCGRDSRCEYLKDGRMCAYYEQKWFGFRAPITVYNYSFLLSELRYATKDVPHRRFLVCDEVHSLEKQLVDFASFRLDKHALEYYHDEVGSGSEFKIPNRGSDDPTAWLDVLLDVQDTLERFLALHGEANAAQAKIAICNDFLEELVSFIEDLKVNPANWVVNSVKADDYGLVEEVVFQPIYVAGYTSSLFSVSDSVLLMSATVFSKESLCRVLGIEESEACFIQIGESTFPVDSRPIYALNTAQLNRASMEASLDSITRVVDEVMNYHAAERGIIHTTSYMQANYIMQHVSEENRRRLVTTEGSFDRSTLLEIHGANDASVLISPSLYQGVDLKDELSRFQVIVKVPYPDLSEKRTAVKLKRDRAWYDWQTALRLVQTYGRSVRSETDHALTYVLDSNFTRFVALHQNLFPKYFLEALKPQ